MNELDSIQASLTSFTQTLDEVTSDRIKGLRKCSFFDLIPSEMLPPISEQAQIRTFAAGDCITSEGDSMNAFYVILFGTATVYYNRKVVGIIRSGECVGESMFFANESLSRSATVVADGQVIAAEIRKDDVERLPANAKAYLDKALLHALFRKLQGANRKIEELMH